MSSPTIPPPHTRDRSPAAATEPAVESVTGGTSRVVLVGALVAVVAVILGLSFFSGGSDEPTADLTASEFQLVDGSSGRLGDFEGQPLVVNFFASWCAPCRAELPDFEEVHQERGDDVTFVGVNTDLAEVTWRSFVQETAITYETVFQPSNELFGIVGGKAMPTTVLVSPEGELLHSHSGLLTKSALNELIDTHLES